MKNPIKTRWFWFLAGLLLMPTVGVALRIASAPDAKRLMPFAVHREEFHSEFYFMGDYTYRLRSQASHVEFMNFVRAMKMAAHQAAPDSYRKVDGDFVIEIFYRDGWINYIETQT